MIGFTKKKSNSQCTVTVYKYNNINLNCSYTVASCCCGLVVFQIVSAPHVSELLIDDALQGKPDTLIGKAGVFSSLSLSSFSFLSAAHQSVAMTIEQKAAALRVRPGRHTTPCPCC